MSIEQPKHPLYALTTFELADYRGRLEQAIANAAADAKDGAGLRTRLDAVLAEQEERAQLAARATS